MNFINFHQSFKDSPIFSINDINLNFPGFDRKILVEWQKKGYLYKIKNSWYTWSDQKKTEKLLFLIANKIYKPSYISLQSVLSLYGFIPEGVFTITSVSSLKTNQFNTPISNFSYKNIKPSLMFGYRLMEWDKGIYCKVAEPEKAILDFLYLNPQYNKIEDFESLRFNNFEMNSIIFSEKMKNYLEYINSKALNSRFKKLTQMLYA